MRQCLEGIFSDLLILLSKVGRSLFVIFMENGETVLDGEMIQVFNESINKNFYSGALFIDSFGLLCKNSFPLMK